MPADIGNPSSSRTDRQIKIRPTLFVALGGTGMEIILRLRRRLLLADWNGHRIRNLGEFPAAAFLYLDTDNRDPRDSEQNTMGKDPFWRAIALESAERIQDKIDVQHYQRQRNALPYINSWLHDKDLSKIDTTHGAGQVRAISRLLFFHKVGDFRNRAVNKLQQLTANMTRSEDLRALGLDVEPKAVRVVVIGSTSGGTGSGTFLDAGYLLRTITDPEPDSVDLFLLLGGAYSKIHTQRTYANTFAALMELEHCARPNSQPPFVTNWSGSLAPRTKSAPYNDVFLYDMSNLGDMRTESREDLFNMIADILFEDFGNGDFAVAKRSHASNTGKYKSQLDLYPSPPDLGEAQRFSLLFSSAGQAVIDTQARVRLEQEYMDCSKQMVRTFFGLTATSSDRMPTPDEVTRALQATLSLTPTIFDRFPNYWDGDPAGVRSYELVGELLRTEAGDQTVVGILSQETTGAITRVRESVPDIKDWPDSIERAIGQLKLNVEEEVGKDRAIVEANVSRRRASMLEQIAGPNGALRALLYDKLEDRDRGGLAFTIVLAKEIQKHIGDEGQGIVADLIATADRFSELADHTITKTIAHSMANLRAAVRERFLRGPDRSTAEVYLGHIQSEVAFYLECRTRARACAHAAGLLRDAAERIGAVTGADADGKERWSGLLGEMVQGQRMVEATLGLIDLELKVLEDIRKRSTGTYLVLPEPRSTSKSFVSLPSEPEALEWAKETLDGYGGLEKLFEKLASEAGRIEVINQVKGLAKVKLGHQETTLPDAVTVMDDAGPAGIEILRDAFRRALPWVNLDVGRINHISDRLDRRAVLIAVPDKAKFERRFLPQIRAFYDGNVSVHQTPERGRIVIYSELSGFPLHALRQIESDWYRSYQEERRNPQNAPLHTHKDAEEVPRFPLPITLDETRLRQLQSDLGAFLKGVLLGIIRRDTDRGLVGVRGDIWWFEDTNGTPLRLGRERTFRLDGLPHETKEIVLRAISDAEQRLTALQVLALAELMRYTATRAYAAVKVRVGDADALRQGFTSKAADVAADYLLQRVRALGGVPALGIPGDLTAISSALKSRLHEWTVEIPDSRDDVDGNEANIDPMDPPDRTAQPKRRVRPEAFSDNALKLMLTQSAPVAANQPGIGGAGGGVGAFETIRKDLQALKEMESLLPAEVYRAKYDELLNRLKSA